MSIAYLLVTLGLVAFGGAAWALVWAVDAGQYDDVEAQGAAILEEENTEVAGDASPDREPSQNA